MEDAPRQPAGASALRQFLGLFVVPLVVVAIAVGVFIGFGWIAMEEGSATDYLNDLQSPWPPRRRQAAYELSRVLNADPKALAEVAGASAEVRRIFTESKDEGVRQYLALVMGHTHDREALPLLVAALGEADSQTRIYAVFALGEIGDPAAEAPLETTLGSSDPGLRKTAAYALGTLGDPRAAPALAARLEDAATDVRWNAALALARLGDRRGVPVLEQMVDRRLLAQVPEITGEQQEEAMLQAIPALTALEGAAARPVLDHLAQGDPSLKVRQAALAARQALDGGGSGG
jgi:HEAT repeat protein